MHEVSLTPQACVHAVSLTPHARSMRYHWHRMQGAFGVIDTACTKKFSNNFKKWKSCAVDERFERLWQQLKGISIKNMYVPELSYPTTKKYINLNALPNKKIFLHAVSLTPHARFLRSKIDPISANSKQNSKRRKPLNQGVLFDEKTEGRKSRDTVPLIW
jgi:hypothetical protein